MTELTGMTCEELTAWVKAQGYPAFRGKQIFRWIHQGADFEGMTNLSKDLREKLQGEAVAQPVKIRLSRKSRLDGTVKFLYELKDGNCVEGVLMRYKFGVSLCISTQVGCRMGCRFCASTRRGLVRDLTAAEMVGQVLAAERDRGEPVSHIVIMGIGEPFDNYENVGRFLDVLHEPKGKNMSYRNMTVSTCGLVEKIRAFGDDHPTVNLAISLHAPNDELRKKTMPVANRYTVAEIVEACKAHAEKTGRRVTYEYALIKDVNATKEAVSELGYATTPVTAQADALMEVAAGTSDAAVIDLLMAYAMVGEGTSYDKLTYTFSLNEEQYGVAFRKGSDLTDALNKFFKDKYADGTLDKLADTYGLSGSVIAQ